MTSVTVSDIEVSTTPAQVRQSPETKPVRCGGSFLSNTAKSWSSSGRMAGSQLHCLSNCITPRSLAKALGIADLIPQEHIGLWATPTSTQAWRPRNLTLPANLRDRLRPALPALPPALHVRDITQPPLPPGLRLRPGARRAVRHLGPAADHQQQLTARHPHLADKPPAQGGRQETRWQRGRGPQ
jgi:hypothetical protein